MADDRQHVLDDHNQAAAPAAQVPAGAVRPGDPGHAAYALDEADYWREAHVREPYYQPGRSFEDYSTAYELGWVGYNLYGGDFDTADRVLANDWIVRKGVSTLAWDEARPAARAAWQRAQNARAFATDGTAAPAEVKRIAGELFETTRDGELGFREAATHARTPELVALLERLAQHCAQAGAQWQECSSRLGGAVAESGTVAGAAQRAWLQVRGLFGGAGDEKLLAQCEGGLDEMAARYREALGRNLPAELHAAVQREFEQAQRLRDHVRTLRERGLGALVEHEQPA